VILGSPKLSEARESAVASIKANADQHAANILPIIREAQKAGATTLRALADALRRRTGLIRATPLSEGPQSAFWSPISPTQAPGR
jgi:hypothetical protein